MKSAVAGVKAGMQAQAKAMKNRKSLFKNIPIKTDGADD